MNKHKVDKLIPEAYRVLAEVKIERKNPDGTPEKDKEGNPVIDRIVVDGKIKKKWRGQISSFGAAISTGSLLAAVAFFSAQGGADVPRELLMQAIGQLIHQEDLFKYVKTTDERHAKEEIINAAIALKLAMNLYELKRGD